MFVSQTTTSNCIVCQLEGEPHSYASRLRAAQLAPHLCKVILIDISNQSTCHMDHHLMKISKQQKAQCVHQMRRMGKLITYISK
jgi:hypothetical protein